jgi:hypothetical protein
MFCPEPGVTPGFHFPRCGGRSEWVLSLEFFLHARLNEQRQPGIVFPHSVDF